MQNKTLAITRQCIPYYKELRQVAGSVTASILMGNYIQFHPINKQNEKIDN